MRITVVGVGADGWDGLPESSRAIVLGADVLLGGERHLAMPPDVLSQRRVPWPSPLRERLPELLAGLDGDVVALASGDPLVAGIGTTLIDILGADAVTVVPAVSSVSLAQARLKWPADSVTVLRDHRRLARHLAEGNRLLVLSMDGSTPAEVAGRLSAAGFGASRLTVLSDLGADTEDRIDGLAASWGDTAVPPLNLLAVEVVSAGGRSLGLTAGLPDDAFEHDGQITKRDVRASALARLSPRAGELLWDVGAGAGSVAVEWLRADTSCQAIAIEARDDRADRIGRNAAALGVPDLAVVTGHAPEALDGLEAPHAVFVGGGATEPGLLDACWGALRPGGRLVVHGVTLETEAVLARRYADLGGELTRLHVEHAAPIGTFTGWTPARAITQWAVTKP